MASSAAGSRVFLSAGPILFLAAGNTVVAFNSASGAKIYSYGGFSDDVSALGLSTSPAGAAVLFAGSSDGTVRSFSVRTAALLNRFDAKAAVTALLVSDGILYVGTAGGSVTLWSADSPDYPHTFTPGGWVEALLVSSGRLYVGCRSGTLTAYDVLLGSLAWSASLPEAAPASHLTLAANGLLYVASAAGPETTTAPPALILAFETESGSPVPEAALGLPDPAWATALIASLERPPMVVVGLESGESLVFVDGALSLRLAHGSREDETAVSRLELLPAAARLVSAGDDKTLRAFDLESGVEVLTLEGHEAPLVGLGVLEGVLYSAAVDKLTEEAEVKAWSLADGSLIRTYQPSAPMYGQIAFGSSRLYASVASRGDITVVNRATGEAVVVPVSEEIVTALSLAGDHLYVGSADGLLRSFDLSDSGFALRRIFEGHSGPITATTADDQVLVSGSTDRSIIVWDGWAGTASSTLTGHIKSISCLVLAGPEALYSASTDGTVRAWHLGSASTLATWSSPSASPIHWMSATPSFLFVVETNRLVGLSHAPEASEFEERAAVPIPGAPESLLSTESFSAQRNLVAAAGSLVVASVGPELHLFRKKDLAYLDTWSDHHVQITSLNVVGSTLYAGSTDIISYVLSDYSRWGVKSAYVESGLLPRLGSRNGRSWIEWALSILILLLEVAQYGALFASTSVFNLIFRPSSTILLWSPPGRLGPLAILVSIPLALVAVFSLGEVAKGARFLNPHRALYSSGLMALNALARILGRAVVLPYFWLLANSLALSVASGVALAFGLLYARLIWRFYGAGESLSGLAWSPRFWSSANDRPALSVRHPFSYGPGGPTHTTVSAAVDKVGLVVALVAVARFAPDWIVVPPLVVGLDAAIGSLWIPPYARDSGRRWRLAADFFILAAGIRGALTAPDSPLPVVSASAHTALDLGLFLGLPVVGYALLPLAGLARGGSSGPGQGYGSLTSPLASPVPGPSGTRDKRGLTEFAGLRSASARSPPPSSSLKSASDQLSRDRATTSFFAPIGDTSPRSPDS